MLLLFSLMAGCTETETLTFDQCEVQATLEPAAAAPGDTILVTGGPFTEVYDTRVLVDGVDAEILEVSRVDCSPCDECLEDYECGLCMTCEHECDEWCGECVQTTTFVVPELEPGPVQAVLLNRYGSTPPLSLVVSESPE